MSARCGAAPARCSPRRRSRTSSSGWQTAIFSNPVTVTGGTPYVVSYHSNGHYAATNNYFTNPGNGPLTAPAGTNGVFTYGTSNAFPTSTFGGANYWVDVLFNPEPNQLPVAVNDSGFTTPQNTSLSIVGSLLWPMIVIPMAIRCP